MADGEYEYVVVGSGAGGGTVAARLAEAGHRVLLLEAGGDAVSARAGTAKGPGADRLPDDYAVPAFHAFASENEQLSWELFVRHYRNDRQQRRDPKYVDKHRGAPRQGVLYPRASTLGGCTAHNALIFCYPHNDDWNHIAELTGDASWRASRMRRHFVRLENCQHRPLLRWLARLGFNPSRHGWRGWLHAESALPLAVLDDGALMETLADSVLTAMKIMGRAGRRWKQLLDSAGDPNGWWAVRRRAEGVFYTPLASRGHGRMGARERVLEVQARYPQRLHVELNALATRILWSGDRRAVGVEYLSGEKLYRAHARPGSRPGQKREARASREVILAGGAFNTPQLLMLSGVGPPEHLQRHGIPVRIPLPGVGRNLQDRYEISVVNRMAFPVWHALQGATFSRGDPLHRQWERDRSGIYTTNGAGLAVIKRSHPQRRLPDLFCMAFLTDFRGYYPGYSQRIRERLNCLSWTLLKAHTVNRAGTVTLRSADPLDPPEVNFHYFEEGDGQAQADLDALVAGIGFIRRMTASLKREGLLEEEELPGPRVQKPDDLKQYIRDQAWGHHASCTCPIGPLDHGGVLTSDFRVHGAEGLRVVDASVFPRIPGFFIACPIYMIAEKASEAILHDAARGPPLPAGGAPS